MIATGISSATCHTAETPLRAPLAITDAAGDMRAISFSWTVTRYSAAIIGLSSTRFCSLSRSSHSFC